MPADNTKDKKQTATNTLCRNVNLLVKLDFSANFVLLLTHDNTHEQHIPIPMTHCSTPMSRVTLTSEGDSTASTPHYGVDADKICRCDNIQCTETTKPALPCSEDGQIVIMSTTEELKVVKYEPEFSPALVKYSLGLPLNVCQCHWSLHWHEQASTEQASLRKLLI